MSSPETTDNASTAFRNRSLSASAGSYRRTAKSAISSATPCRPGGLNREGDKTPRRQFCGCVQRRRYAGVCRTGLTDALFLVPGKRE